ncbi:MAG: hypothetical protein MUO52_17275 [Desulfobacterales bacterium]|nr:hypothetical protein [Desulfobacterales bacterium]
MADFSYSGQVTPGSTISRVNANGRMVSIGEFEGRFVWTDYAAPWCEPCVAQAQEIQRIEKRFGDKMVFLTVMTSVSPGNPKEVPDRQAARAWAQRFSLDPERVVAATNLFGWTVPTHILYSPQAQTLYRSTGYLPGDQNMNILSAYMRDWEEWSQSGRTASPVRQ